MEKKQKLCLKVKPLEQMEKQSYVSDDIEIKNENAKLYLNSINDGSIDLILTDPPYIISKKSGMDTHYKTVKYNDDNKITHVKSNEEWEEYKTKNDIINDEKKNLYIKYGTIYGKKYCVQTDYGDWDENFTVEDLEYYISIFYSKLRKGGTLIMFFDLWKVSYIKELLDKYKYSQIRFIEWIKTNPQPRNRKINYLTNCREIALLAIKGTKPTFNSAYDKGIYEFPLQGGKYRTHPTQKNLQLFKALIEKHSNENDVVLDPFLGSGTTAVACKVTHRKFVGCEISSEYFDNIVNYVNKFG